MARKWIINDGVLKMGNVELHRELAQKHDTTLGGGYFYINRNSEEILLYAKSEDFGYCTYEQVKEALPKSYLSVSLDGYKVYFAPYSDLSMADSEKQLVGIL